MSYTTSTLGMSLAVPGSGQLFEPTVVNGNWLILEAGIIADRARLTTLEGNAGRGSGADYAVGTLAALNAIATAVNGDTAYVTAVPSTGSQISMYFIRSVGKWKPAEGARFNSLSQVDQFKTDLTTLTNIVTDRGLLGFALTENVYFRWLTAGDGSYLVLGNADQGFFFDHGFANVAVTGTIGSGVTIATKTFASVPYATTIRLRAFGRAGGNASAVGVGVAITASAGTLTKLTEDTTHWSTAAATAYTPVEAYGQIVVPASTVVTVTIASLASGTAIYAVGYEWEVTPA